MRTLSPPRRARRARQAWQAWFTRQAPGAPPGRQAPAGRQERPPRPPRPPRSMDPRIRERRIAVQRDRGRRRLRVLGTFFAGLAVSGLTLAVLHSPWLSVSRVEVAGAAGPQAAAVTAALAPFRHRPLASLDPAAVARTVEGLPWVRTVRVHRGWPSTLTVTVDARVPVAQLQDPTGRWAAVDATGRVVAVSPAPTPGLVDLGGTPGAGPAGSLLGPAAAGALSVAADLPADLRARTASVAPEPGGGVTLTVAGGPVVDLGPPTDLTAKLQALETVLGSVDMTGVHTVDLRLPDQPVLTRQ